MPALVCRFCDWRTEFTDQEGRDEAFYLAGRHETLCHLEDKRRMESFDAKELERIYNLPDPRPERKVA